MEIGERNIVPVPVIGTGDEVGLPVIVTEGGAGHVNGDVVGHHVTGGGADHVRGGGAGHVTGGGRAGTEERNTGTEHDIITVHCPTISCLLSE